jgi:hypothetical protein
VFISGRAYRHLTSRDVTYKVVKAQYCGPHYWRVRLMYQTPYSVFGPETVVIRRKDFWKWREVNGG